MVTHSVAEIIRKPVMLEVEGIDRLYLNGYVPMLQTAPSAGFADRFDRSGSGMTAAAAAGMTAAFVKSIE